METQNSSNTYPTDYHYLYGQPEVQARIRSCDEDFKVFEIPAFIPDGEGEHWFIKIRKRGENTDWVAKELQRYCDVTSRDIGYAGKKDRHAITEQWFSVCIPGTREIDWQGFNRETIEVLEVTKHTRKLRTGALAGNRFELRLREVSDDALFTQRLSLIERGVPNYFGEQRFGHHGANLSRGISLLQGAFKEKNRTKKGLYISAVRSWFFNHVLSARIAQDKWQQIMSGDVMMLEGSKSHFSADETENLTSRLMQADIHLSGPLCGRGRSPLTGDALQWEQQLLEPHAALLERLDYAGLSCERRALRLIPKGLSAQNEGGGCWRVSFELPPGTFATSVLRELCQYQVGASEAP
ncbi:MAG: tRNA pseudouridine(13) synthase TruD [Pseudomonadales bacterium]